MTVTVVDSDIQGKASEAPSALVDTGEDTSFTDA
jgi:hypothetical protein